MKNNIIKIQEWREVRIENKKISENEQILNTIRYWERQPIVNYVLNYNDYEHWPTPWELITDGYYDSIVIAYLMMETLILSGWKKERFILKYIKPDENSDYIMVLVVDNKYVLNYSYGEIFDVKLMPVLKTVIKLQYDNNKLKEIK